jgi:hypothetical protein
MTYKQYVANCMEVLENHTENLSSVELTGAWKTIEDAPAFTGKIWIEDTLDRIYRKKLQ